MHPKQREWETEMMDPLGPSRDNLVCIYVVELPFEHFFVVKPQTSCRFVDVFLARNIRFLAVLTG